ncbi:MAG: hypothetical protein SangKO_100230 [Sandaracinaceae bacterium]
MSTNPTASETDATTPSTPKPHVETKRDLIREVATVLQPATLPDDPFPTCVTARNTQTAERLASWVETTREGADSLVERLREMPDDAPVSLQKNTRLRKLAREWRVLDTFRQLHEAAQCPGVFFRLRTKADFLTLCDREADSSAAGYGERQRHVLAKRGISHRHTWAEARRLVAQIGLLDGDSCAAPASFVSGDGLATPEDAVADSVATSSVPSGEEDAGSEVAPETPLAGAAPETLDCDLPEVRLDAVWTLLPGFTKAKLGAVAERFGIGLWAQFGDRFYGSMRKAEMLDHTRRVVRHHACLDAAHQMSESQVEDLHDWMRSTLGRSSAHGERYQKDADLHIAARLFGDFQASAALSASGSGLSPDAWNAYRDAELRRIAAFCYHIFYEQRCSQRAGA